jgi:hypothetical protein
VKHRVERCMEGEKFGKRRAKCDLKFVLIYSNDEFIARNALNGHIMRRFLSVRIIHLGNDLVYICWEGGRYGNFTENCCNSLIRFVAIQQTPILHKLKCKFLKIAHRTGT